ncbi:ParA family protein [Alicyclobacillus sp. SP_1]|uniref:ParA family protein n=1 Tax=Alicyclobacillus sp. SP_1 TaxID=2942475 RepID=UPI0021575514|nr:ParA family protein [Alicyclobacillus sp. SP_1]
MGHVISFGLQKGGVGKTTTVALTSWILSKDHKVLSVDFDSQGNLTMFLSNKNIYSFTHNTILEAVINKNPKPYIVELSDTLHLLPAEDLLATFPRYLYQEYRGAPAKLLKETLSVIKDDYDYILIDLPPNLGDQTINGLTASDYAVVVMQSEPFAYDALDRYLETLQHVQRLTNPDLRLAGILTTLLDTRTNIDHSILEQARADYGEVVFETIIRKRNRIKEFILTGISDRTAEDRRAMDEFYTFTKELEQRVR